MVQRIGAGMWRVTSDSGNRYIVSHVDDELLCDCLWAQNMLEAGIMGNNCRHVVAVLERWL